MRTFGRKGYGRIYVEQLDEIEIVENIIKEMNEFEHGYLPTDFITTYNQFPQVKYNGKFDELDLDLLTYKCYLKGIFIFCFSTGSQEFAHYSEEDLHGKK